MSSLPPPLLLEEDDGSCRWCLRGVPVAFIGGAATCPECLDQLRAIAERQGDTMRCRAPVDSLEVAS